MHDHAKLLLSTDNIKDQPPHNGQASSPLRVQIERPRCPSLRITRPTRRIERRLHLSETFQVVCGALPDGRRDARPSGRRRDLPFGPRRPLHIRRSRALRRARRAALDGEKLGSCWDNALAESFFATRKLELIEPGWPTRARARSATVHRLDAVYNRQRRHLAIDMLSPVDYEERYWDRRAAA